MKLVIIMLLTSTNLMFGQESLAQLKATPSYTQLFKKEVNERNSIITPKIKTTAFFCKLEEKNDKKSKTKLRFRLGDQNTVDRLEGK